MDAIGPSAPQAQAPSGILESADQVPIPIPTAPQAPEPSRPGSQPSRQSHINIFKFLVVFFFPLLYNDIRNISYSGKQNFPFDRKRNSLFRERI